MLRGHRFVGGVFDGQILLADSSFPVWHVPLDPLPPKHIGVSFEFEPGWLPQYAIYNRHTVWFRSPSQHVATVTVFVSKALPFPIRWAERTCSEMMHLESVAKPSGN